MNRVSRRLNLWIGGLLALLATVGVLLYAAPAEAPSDLQAMRDLTTQQLLIDSQFSESLLRNRHGVAHNYDAMIDRHAALRAGAMQLKALQAPSDNIRETIAAYAASLLVESEQLETFKSLNAAVRNATRYYQFEALRLIDTLPDTSANRPLKRKLHAFALDTARLSAGGEFVAAQGSLSAVEVELAAAAEHIPEQRDTFLRLIKHGKRVAGELPRLHAATTALLHNRRHEQLTRLQGLLDGQLAHETAQAQQQRRGFAALAVVLMVALGFVIRRRMRDVAARLAAEDKMRELSQAVEQSPNIIVVTDLEGNIEYVNAALDKIAGFRPDEVIGANMRALRSGKTPPETYRELWETLRAGRIWQGEFINRRKDGSEYIGAAVIGPVRQADGRIAHYVGVQEDVTEKKRNEAELARHREHLEEMIGQRTVELSRAAAAAEAANVAKSRFLATMSHELRTPMNGVLGMAQLLLNGPADAAETREYARTILHSGQTLLTLLNDILDLSKVESGKLTLEAGIVSPAELLHDTEALFSSNAQDRGLVLITRWNGPTGRRYRGDPHRLQQMLSNLTNNAIKFTASGTVNIEADELANEGSSALIEFTVRDTGIGIPADKQALLFRPFSQIDDSTTRQFGGTGLGLSIVRSLARLMDGEVGVESQEGQGSRFWFRIRLATLADHTDTRAQQRADAATVQPRPAAQRLGGRILVVEDNPVNQKVVGALLKKLGVETAVVDNGQMAVERITAGSESFDAILMDIQMPVLDGYGATTRIRAWEAELGRAPLPIIALTADAFAEDQARCREVGMNDYLSKPINADALTAALARWLPADAST